MSSDDLLPSGESTDDGVDEDSSHDDQIEILTEDSSQEDQAENVSKDATETSEEKPPKKKKRKRRRQPNRDAAELRMQGRRSLCKSITDIAPDMLKTVKLRIMGRYLDSTKGLDESDLEKRIIKDAKKLSDKKRVIENLHAIDSDVNRRTLKAIIIYGVLLQEESHSLEERRLEEKVIEFEKEIVKRGKAIDFFDQQKHDPMRWHHYDTYRIVLEAAWRNDNDISYDEASLLHALRQHLSISLEEHWQIGVHIKRFPKVKRAIHTAEEIHEARKELQRDGILWSYRDENNRSNDVIPLEIVSVIRNDDIKVELQRTNYRRILQHDSIRVSDLRAILQAHNMDRYGNKADLIERLANSDLKPSRILNNLDRPKLAEMCIQVALKSSGNKADIIQRLIDFYDDLTFEERVTQDIREEWYNNFELLAARSYADLRAKKIIVKDLDVEHQFEKATDFLFETKLRVGIDTKRKITKADGRIPLKNRQVLLWDCKSVESELNLQDHLESQFEGYLRREREGGCEPLAFLVIAPKFTKSSLKLAHQFKARTNWDIALIHADAIKFLADQWCIMEGAKEFPIALFNRTEIIDKERAEFLLSLA